MCGREREKKNTHKLDKLDGAIILFKKQNKKGTSVNKLTLVFLVV
jgi:hypothetical protein